MLLGLLWTVFRKFAMKPTAVVNDSISSNTTSPRGPAPNGSRMWKNTEESLLEWVKLSMTAAYLFVVVSEFNIFRHSGVAVKSLKNRFVLVGIFGNFSFSFASGLPFAALVREHWPDAFTISWEAITQVNKKENIF